jgi:hypothetical protein
LLTRAEKEKRVIELYEQDKTYREIAKEVHMSLGNISSIIGRHTGEVKPGRGHQHAETIDTQTFKLFEGDHTPVQVAIKLNIKSEEVTKLYTEYLKLKGLEELSLPYEERREDLDEFHGAYKLMVNKGVSPQHLIDAANRLQELPSVESRCELIKREVEGLEIKSGEIYSSIVTASQDLNSINLGIDVHKKELDRLNYEKRQYESLIAGVNSSAGCDRIRAIAEATARSILTDNRVVLEAALRALLQALSEEPRNQLQLVIYGSLRNPLYEPSNAKPPQNYIQLR